MSRTSENKMLSDKLERIEPGVPVVFTEPEARVLKGFARVLLGVPFVFGSVRWIAIFATMIFTAVIAGQAAYNILVMWLASGGSP